MLVSTGSASAVAELVEATPRKVNHSGEKENPAETLPAGFFACKYSARFPYISAIIAV